MDYDEGLFLELESLKGGRLNRNFIQDRGAIRIHWLDGRSKGLRRLGPVADSDQRPIVGS